MEIISEQWVKLDARDSLRDIVCLQAVANFLAVCIEVDCIVLAALALKLIIFGSVRATDMV